MRVYVALVWPDEESGGTYVYVPIKRDGYPYAGMPQFFGGGMNPGETKKQTLTREVDEESDENFAYAGGNPLALVHQGQAGGQQLKFYWTSNFTGEFVGDLDQGEMQSITRVFLPEQEPGYSMADFFASLGIQPTPEFAESETYEAFGRLIEIFTQ